MIVTNHAIAGAIIAVVVQQPLVAIIASFASHFVLDALPHFGIDVKGKNVAIRNNLPLFRAVLRIDILLILLAFIFIPVLLKDTVAIVITILCMIAAVSPDFVWIYRYIKEYKTGVLLPKGLFSRFHKWIQWGERPWGWVFDLTWLLFSIGILLNLLR